MIKTDISLDEMNKWGENTMLSHLGIVLTEVGLDFLSGKMPVDHRTKQPYGLLHGGASVVLAETLGSMASSFCIDQSKQFCVGLEINANHIRSVTQGYVYGKATLIHLGKKTHIWEIKITDENKKLVCISRITMAVLDKENKG